jgi:hypothetical protein
MLTDGFINCDRDIVTGFDPYNRMVVYLHGCDSLGNVGNVPEDVDLVTQL